MARVKIKCQNSKDKDKKIALLQILSLNQVYATRVISMPDGFVVLTNTDNDLDTIFRRDVKNSLNESHFTPIVPPELKAKMTVIRVRVDDYIYGNNTDEIKEELIRENNWIAEDDMEETFKFPKSNTIKITFQQTTTTEKTVNSGLLMFSMFIPTTQIKQEEFINITTCLRCYELEKHYTNQCTKPKDYKICSECRAEGHTKTAMQKCCLNCKIPHRTLAMRCPARKALENRRTLKEDTKTFSYQNNRKQRNQNQPRKRLPC